MTRIPGILAALVQLARYLWGARGRGVTLGAGDQEPACYAPVVRW